MASHVKLFFDYRPISKLPNLVALSVASSFFKILNPAFVVFRRLHWNKLTGVIPSEIWAMKRLQVLSVQYTLNLHILMLAFRDLSDNQLTGEIPLEIAKLPRLEYLSVQYSGNSPSNVSFFLEIFRGTNSQGRY